MSERGIDQKLVVRVQKGDKAAFDLLVRKYQHKVAKLVARFVRDRGEIEDVTQEVFIAALRSLGTFRGEARFSTWLRTLTNHKVAEYYRKRSRKKETMQIDLIHAEKQGDHTSASLWEERIALRRALLTLPEQYREVILLRFAEGLQFSTIASVLKQNPEATKSLFRRAMSALRNTLDVNDD